MGGVLNKHPWGVQLHFQKKCSPVTDMCTVNLANFKSKNDRTDHIYPSRPLPTPEHVMKIIFLMDLTGKP